MSLRRPILNPPLIIALVAIALYAVTLNGTFVYDDIPIIQTDRRIADPHNWGGYWNDSYNFGVDNLYRPLVSMTYAIQRYVHGMWGVPFHLLNVLLHGLCSVLVAILAIKLARRCEVDERSVCAIGWVAGLLFAAHPVHVEAVANIVGRAEMTCAIGVLGAMVLFLSPLTRFRVAGILGCFFFALLSKEQGMLVPLLLGVIAVAQSGPLALWEKFKAKRQKGAEVAGASSISGKNEKEDLAPILFVLLSITLAGYVSFRESILKFWWDKNFLDAWIQPLSAPEVTMVDRLLVPISIAGRYLQLLVAPITLRIDYGGVIVPGTFRSDDPYFYLGIGAIALWIVLLAIALRQKDRFTIVCLFCFAFIYGLLGNLVTIIGVNMAERLMYLPSAFFVMIVARWMCRLPRPLWSVTLGAILIAFSIRTVTYARQWNDKLGLYVYAMKVEPRSLKAAQLAMQEFLDRGELDEAEHYGRAAIAIKPEHDDAYLRLAMVMIARGKFDEAQTLIDKARALNPVGKADAHQMELNMRRDARPPATMPTTPMSPMTPTTSRAK